MTRPASRSARSGTATATSRPPARAAARPGSGRPSARSRSDDESSSAVRPAVAVRSEKPGSQRIARTEVPHKRSKLPWVVVACSVLAVAALIAWRPLRRSQLLRQLDAAQGQEAITIADTFLAFSGRSESAVRQVVAGHHGPVAARQHLGESIKSLAALVALIEDETLTDAERVAALHAAAGVADPERHHGERRPRELSTWAETAVPADLQIAAIELLAAFGRIDNGEEAAALCARLAARPDLDADRRQAAISALASLTTEKTVGLGLGLLRQHATVVLAHEAFMAALTTYSDGDQAASLIELIDHTEVGVRAFALGRLGKITLPVTTDARRRADLGTRISAKLIPATPAAELSAALQAVRGLRLTGARDAVIALAGQRKTLGLTGIDEAWWVQCLGEALTPTTPADLRSEGDRTVVALTAALADPAVRTVAASALGLVRDAGLPALRPALDGLAAQAAEPACVEALRTLAAKTYSRDDVARTCGSDVAAWQHFIAEDRPHAQRLAEIRTFVDANRDAQRIADGRERLGEVKTFLDAARDELQAWADDTKFVPPLGVSKEQIRSLFREVNELNVSVRKAFSGAVD